MFILLFIAEWAKETNFVIVTVTQINLNCFHFVMYQLVFVHISFTGTKYHFMA